MIDAPLRIRIRPSRTGVIVVVLIVATIIGLIVIIQAQARKVGKRIDCSNNLQQLGIATIAFDGTKGDFPSDNNPLHPDQSFYQQLVGDLEISDRMPDGTVNPNAAVKFFVCPGRRRAQDVPGACDYGYVSLNGATSRAILESDPAEFSERHPPGKVIQNAAGTANTALLSHIWISPDEYHLARPRWASRIGHTVPYSKATRGYLDTDPDGVGCMGSPHPNGMPTIFADGHVGFLRYTYPQFQMLWDYSNTTVVRQNVP